jgi:hypothetical protein
MGDPWSTMPTCDDAVVEDRVDRRLIVRGAVGQAPDAGAVGGRR